MIAFVPALDRAAPQHPADRIGKFKRAALKLRRGSKPRQAMNVGLVLGNVECRHVLHDRIGTGKAEWDVVVLGDTAGIEHDVTRELRIGALEEFGYAHRKRIDRAQDHLRIIVGDQLQRLRQRQIAVGTAKRKEQIDGQGHRKIRPAQRERPEQSMRDDTRPCQRRTMPTPYCTAASAVLRTAAAMVSDVAWSSTARANVTPPDKIASSAQARCSLFY